MKINKLISIPVRTDGDGYYDKQCPNVQCKFEFKVDNKDWKNIFKDEAMYCPKCGHSTLAKNFVPSSFARNAKAQAKKLAIDLAHSQVNKVLNELSRDLSNMFRGNSSIKFTESKSSIYRPKHFIQPISAKKEFEQKIHCDKCNANYAVIGFAFFCPSCGKNSAEKTFDDSLNHIEFKLQLCNSEAVCETASKDNAERFKISSIEEGIKECVTTFETYCKTVYMRFCPSADLRQGVFQRLVDGSGLWKNLLGYGYDNWLDTVEMARLMVLFQDRHLLIHHKGFVDQDYLSKVANSPYKLGQKIVISQANVMELISLIRKIVKNIREQIILIKID